jgi:hypothetical protein
VHFRKISQLAKGTRIAKGDKADAVVSEGREARNSGGLLAATVTSSRDEHASEFAVQLALLPELAGSIPEGLVQKNTKPQPDGNKTGKKLRTFH